MQTELCRNRHTIPPRLAATLRVLRCIGLAFIIAPLIAASGMFCYRVARNRSDTAAARTAAMHGRTDAERVAGMVAAYNDAAATIEALRSVSREPGIAGDRAATLLRYLHNRSAK
jgi:hypothetical protein